VISRGGSVLSAAGSGMNITAGANSSLQAFNGVVGTQAAPITARVSAGTLGIHATAARFGTSAFLNGTVLLGQAFTMLNAPPALYVSCMPVQHDSLIQRGVRNPMVYGPRIQPPVVQHSLDLSAGRRGRWNSYGRVLRRRPRCARDPSLHPGRRLRTKRYSPHATLQHGRRNGVLIGDSPPGHLASPIKHRRTNLRSSAPQPSATTEAAGPPTG